MTPAAENALKSAIASALGWQVAAVRMAGESLPRARTLAIVDVISSRNETQTRTDRTYHEPTRDISQSFSALWLSTVQIKIESIDPLEATRSATALAMAIHAEAPKAILVAAGVVIVDQLGGITVQDYKDDGQRITAARFDLKVRTLETYDDPTRIVTIETVQGTSPGGAWSASK